MLVDLLPVFCRSINTALRWSKIYLKREDLNHTGAHKVNNTIGQALLAKHMGKNANYRRDRSRSTWSCECYSCG